MANRQALEALDRGAEALCFRLHGIPAKAELATLLQNIQHEQVSTNFMLQDKAPENLISNFIALLKEKGQKLEKVDCAFQINTRFNNNDLKWWREQLPQAKILSLESLSYRSKTDMIHRELAHLIDVANQYLTQIHQSGLGIKNFYHSFQFVINIGDSYFLTIAKIRALKLLWQYLLKAWGMELTSENLPFIEAHITDIYQTKDEHYNKIKATTQAMSAVIGGVNRLYIYPSDEIKRKMERHFRAE